MVTGPGSGSPVAVSASASDSAAEAGGGHTGQHRDAEQHRPTARLRRPGASGHVIQRMGCAHRRDRLHRTMRTLHAVGVAPSRGHRTARGRSARPCPCRAAGPRSSSRNALRRSTRSGRGLQQMLVGGHLTGGREQQRRHRLGAAHPVLRDVLVADPERHFRQLLLADLGGCVAQHVGDDLVGLEERPQHRPARSAVAWPAASRRSRRRRRRRRPPSRRSRPSPRRCARGTPPSRRSRSRTSAGPAAASPGVQNASNRSPSARAA